MYYQQKQQKNQWFLPFFHTKIGYFCHFSNKKSGK